MTIMADELLFTSAREVRDRCFCLHLQAAARAVASRFDTALKPFGLTNGQYALLVTLSRPQPTSLDELARQLVLQRPDLMTALQPLLHRGLLQYPSIPKAHCTARIELTTAALVLLTQAEPAWRATHAALETLLLGSSPDGLRGDLLALAFGEEGDSG